MSPRAGEDPHEVLRADSIVVRIGDRNVLTSATLRAEAGKITVLFGRNGAGKSTLLHVAAGLRRATSGVVHLKGHVYPRASLVQLARAGLFVLPDRDLLSPAMTIRRHLELTAARFDRPYLEDAATLVGLSGQVDQPAGRCSGGERRLAEVALAWLRAPVCLLADEPYWDVAPILGERLSLVFRRVADEGCAVVVTGHDPKRCSLLRTASCGVRRERPMSSGIPPPRARTVASGSSTSGRVQAGPGRDPVHRTPASARPGPIAVEHAPGERSEHPVECIGPRGNVLLWCD